jgi:lipoprotein-anchoring transpeptidase ErfK/SrfK
MQRSPRVLRVGSIATAIVAVLAVASPVASGVVTAEPPSPREAKERAASATAWTSVGAAVLQPDVAHAIHQAADAVATHERARRSDRRPAPELLVEIPQGGLVARRSPRSSAPSVGRVVDRSRFYGVPTVAWVERTTRDGGWGRIELPYVWPRRDGWVRIDGLRSDTTHVRVVVDLSAHRLTLSKRGEVLFRAPVATGRATSPTPRGHYFVTDRVSFRGGGVFGSFGFGLSGIQPRLPAGWTSGDQIAIHGTNEPWSIGTSASAGCLRASEATLARLKPLLRLGTPVTIVR